MALGGGPTKGVPSGGIENGTDKAEATAFDTVVEISNLLETGLDNEELLMCTKLIESGVNPIALAMSIHTIKQGQYKQTSTRK
ncbi:hypothetical protein CSKR_101931 [Clonorchis sinensis]|uniref:Uncharacterized protein n=2 Tax=Clonorchis sinensis TaxID=79923 RepID=A0A8T1MHK0_CLOSI|nr:hypothetical protein CSKR_101931 [Clonorchis sinensis]GAA48610.1 hypothetical protein CLF_101816 [Clonorchis sinensis]